MECSSPYPGLHVTLCNLCYFCLLFAHTHSQTHPPAAGLRPRGTRLVPDHFCYVWGWPCGIQPPTPPASCSFVLLLQLLPTCFLPIPTAKSTRPQQNGAPVSRARRQSSSATCGGGRMEYSPQCPGFLQLSAALGSLVLLLPTFWPIPVAKQTRLQQNCDPVARARC